SALRPEAISRSALESGAQLAAWTEPSDRTEDPRYVNTCPRSVWKANCRPSGETKGVQACSPSGRGTLRLTPRSNWKMAMPPVSVPTASTPCNEEPDRAGKLGGATVVVVGPGSARDDDGAAVEVVVLDPVRAGSPLEPRVTPIRATITSMAAAAA